MGDSERTPLRTARVSTERFETELAAVWYAANYYYESSFRRGGEYIGVVFEDPAADPASRFGITVRGDGGFASSKVTIGDIPKDTIPRAVWHTHVPSTSGRTSLDQKLMLFILTAFDMGWEEFSGADKALSDNASDVLGYRFPIYLVTDTVIKRYRGHNLPDKVWSKDPPGRMAKGSRF